MGFIIEIIFFLKKHPTFVFLSEYYIWKRESYLKLQKP
jgi:hypothetical protein